MQLQFLAPVEFIFQTVERLQFFDPGGIFFLIYSVPRVVCHVHTFFGREFSTIVEGPRLGRHRHVHEHRHVHIHRFTCTYTSACCGAESCRVSRVVVGWVGWCGVVMSSFRIAFLSFCRPVMNLAVTPPSSCRGRLVGVVFSS